MLRQRLCFASVLVLFYFVTPSRASDAKSFYAYLKEVAQPVAAESGREGRQSIGLPLAFTFSLNGISNFTFATASIPTNFPIACGGDDRNYCNYPDLPLIETYDLNYFSRRPIPSGRCPDGYTKMPTFDCLNIAPALFETTCCMFLGGTVPNICSSSVTIDAFWTLCNGSYYISSGAYAWEYDQNWKYRSGPTLLAALTGGCVSRDLSEAEADGNCNVQFFNLNDQYFITDYQTGSLGCSGPNLVTDLCLTGTPGIVFSTGGRGCTLIYKIDGDGYQAVIGDGYNYLIGGNQTCNVAVTVPGIIGQSPLINASAATYGYLFDDICFIYVVNGVNTVQCTTRSGVSAFGPTALNSVLSNCLATTTTSTSNIAPLVYIPYPIYPIFTGQQQSNSPSPSSSYGSSSPAQSYSSAPAPSMQQSYGSSPAQSGYGR